MKTAIQLSLVSLVAGNVVLKGETASHAIHKHDFVYVDGLRLHDAKGLHYITGNTNAAFSLLDLTAKVMFRY